MASVAVAPKTSTVKLTLRSRTDDARQRAALEICKINIPDPKPVNVSVCNMMLVDAKREIHVAYIVNDIVFAWKEEKCEYEAAVSPMHNGKSMTLTLPAGCMLQFVKGVPPQNSPVPSIPAIDTKLPAAIKPQLIKPQLEYVTISDNKTTSFDKQVNQRLSEGWEPQGGVTACVDSTGGLWLFLGMIRSK